MAQLYGATLALWVKYLLVRQQLQWFMPIGRGLAIFSGRDVAVELHGLNLSGPWMVCGIS
jgi:hypothetical protein